jgi:hypothetical protein
MALMRVAVTSAVTLSHTFAVDAAALDAAGAVTVAVKRLDGTAVTAGTASVGTVGDGIYTFPLPAQATLDTLTVDWTGTFGGAAFTGRDFVEVVGGFLFGLPEAYAMKPVLDPVKYPVSTVARKRIEVEQECEQICGQAFVPRYARVALSGRGIARLVIPRSETGGHTMLRTLRTITVSGVAWSAPDVAAVGFTDTGVLTRPGGAMWPLGFRNIVVEYEHGLDYPPDEIGTAGIVRLRSKLGLGDTSVPYRALSFTAAEGGTYRLSTPAADRTGIPDVDAVYARHPGPKRTVFA